MDAGPTVASRRRRSRRTARFSGSSSCRACPRTPPPSTCSSATTPTRGAVARSCSPWCDATSLFELTRVGTIDVVHSSSLRHRSPSRNAVRRCLMRRILTVTAMIAVAALGLTAVWASTFTARPLTQVSGASPFAGCTADNVAGQPGLLFLNSEVEPMVDVNPTDARNLVGGYQQDRWSGGGSRGLVAAVSLDGGTTWTNVAIPKITRCSGGTVDNGGDFKRATDPWLSFAPNGDLYFMSLSLDIETPPNAPGGVGKSAMFVSKSIDRGLTWGDPVKLIEDT